MISIPSKVNNTLKRKIQKAYDLKSNLKKLNRNFDVFICSSGYEERTIGMLQKSGKHFTCNQPIIFLYHPAETPLYIKNLESLEKIKKMLQQVSPNTARIVEMDPVNPWKFREILKEVFTTHSINASSRVLVDITSFTRVFLYELIKSLYVSGCSFILCYTEPMDYAQTMAAGVSNLVIAPSFMGRPRPNNKTFFLVFLGWETGRSKDTFESFNSDDHVGVIGVEPIDEKHIGWQFESYRKNRELIRTISEVQTCPTLELDSICKFIERIYVSKNREYEKKNERIDIAMCGFGPKIQNVAISLFALTHKDVQLVYGAPSYWGSSSTGIKTEVPIESYGIGSSYIYGPFDKQLIDSRYS